MVEVRAGTALVRLNRSASCAGCASAGQCRTGSGESERLLEARNDVGASAGDAVRVAVSGRSALGAPARGCLLPLVGALLGAGLAELFVAAVVPSQAGGNAAGLGGAAGAILGWLLGRRPARPPAPGAAAFPRITRVDAGVDAPCGHG